MSKVEDRVDELMVDVPLEHSRRWCEAKEGCACMGCVNGSQKIPITRAQWQSWLDRQRLHEMDLHQLAEASTPEHIIIRKLIHTIRAIQSEWDNPPTFGRYSGAMKCETEPLKCQIERKQLPIIEGWNLQTTISDAGVGIAKVSLEGIRKSDGAYHEVSSTFSADLMLGSLPHRTLGDALQLLIQDFLKSAPPENAHA